MKNKPTKQYLEYLISTYTDMLGVKAASSEQLNFSHINSNQLEFQYSSSLRGIQTNECENASKEDDDNS